MSELLYLYHPESDCAFVGTAADVGEADEVGKVTRYPNQDEFEGLWLSDRTYGCPELPKYPTIIAGSRDINDPRILEDALCKCPWVIGGVISGCARGVDSLGEQWATYFGLPVRQYPADWVNHPKTAGFIRNAEMSAFAKKVNGRLLVVWDGVSRGTRHMITQAEKQGLVISVYRI